MNTQDNEPVAIDNPDLIEPEILDETEPEMNSAESVISDQTETVEQEVKRVTIDETETVAREIKRFTQNLNNWATQLQTAAIVIPLIAILMALLIGFFAEELKPILIKIMAFISAVCTISLLVLKLDKKAQDMKEAYHLLQDANYKYRTQVYSIEDLINSGTTAEKIIG